MSAGILDKGIVVDVRDMLCAQALAVVAKVMNKLTNGASVEVFYTANDVKQDLIIWAESLGYTALEIKPLQIKIIKRG